MGTVHISSNKQLLSSYFMKVTVIYTRDKKNKLDCELLRETGHKFPLCPKELAVVN